MNVDKYGIWKGAVEQYLPLLLKRMMPELYEDADFTQDLTFLDKELRDTIQAAKSEEHNAAKYVDTLVQVPLKTGKNEWVLLHIEVQGEGGEDISFRMILYCCLIFAHYRRMPVALAILTDKRPLKETPRVFDFREYGTELIYKYNLFEVYEQNDEELLTSDNPFDSFIYAAKNYSKYMKEEDRRRILVFISRLINLKNAELKKQFIEELEELEGESNMRELTLLEEYFRDQAIAIGEERTLKAAIEFMRLNGMSNEQINKFRASIK